MSTSGLLRRRDLVAGQLAHLPFGSRTFTVEDPAVRVGATGTGDDLLLLPWSESELARERAAGARLFARLGLAAGMRIGNALPGALATPGALLMGDVVEEIGALDVPLGVIETPAQARAAWELLDRVEVAVLVLDPSRAETLLTHAPTMERPWWRGIVWLDRPGQVGVVPAVAGPAGWQRRWLAVPEVTSFVSVTCEAGAHHPDTGIRIEVAEGELVLGSGAAPEAPRFATGMHATLVDRCACGSSGPAMTLG